jgi:long-subunit acyl-CoA synthetase (AMP-forming)
MKEYNMLNRGSEMQVKYIFTSDSWNVENGLLNPDKSLNRNALYNKYRNSIDTIYSGSTESK